MACSCLSDDTWYALSQMRTTTSLTTTLHVEDPEKLGPNSSMADYPIEKVFPVYAVGVSEPDPNLIVSVANTASTVGDPIWDAVKLEAKLEVQFPAETNTRCFLPICSSLSGQSYLVLVAGGRWQAEKEPILSSFLYASILTHDCLDRALSFVLSNRLQNPTLLATQLMDIFCDVIMHDRCIQCSIRLDLQACKDRDPSCLSYCSALLYLKGYHSLQTHRVAHALWNQGRKVLALALQSRVSEVFGVDIHPAAKIGDGILLDHATGVVIGETAVIGNRVSLMQGVTLGGTGKETGDRHPQIGQGALIGASVTILGNIKVGEGAMVGAGSLVMKDVPPHSMVTGIPAKVIGYVDDQDPSLTMKHDASKEFFKKVAISCKEARSNGDLSVCKLDSIIFLGSPMMQHESRRHNNVADKLAKQGKKLTPNSCFEVWFEPSDFVNSLMNEDTGGPLFDGPFVPPLVFDCNNSVRPLQTTIELVQANTVSYYDAYY
ncbi:Serine acetyltransferase 2 [Capsicum annuum]|nr:Serine acetyltransferase 2 [Capsicum annuum]